MKVVFKTMDGQAIKTWINMEYAKGGVPQSGDVVILHWGDEGEESERYIVRFREFDGTDVDCVTLYVDSVDYIDDYPSVREFLDEIEERFAELSEAGDRVIEGMKHKASDAS